MWNNMGCSTIAIVLVKKKGAENWKNFVGQTFYLRMNEWRWHLLFQLYILRNIPHIIRKTDVITGHSTDTRGWGAASLSPRRNCHCLPSASPLNSIRVIINYFLFPHLYSIEYARITSTIGALHNGHFPPPRTNSFAQFEQVHMCPHLQ